MAGERFVKRIHHGDDQPPDKLDNRIIETYRNNPGRSRRTTEFGGRRDNDIKQLLTLNINFPSLFASFRYGPGRGSSKKRQPSSKPPILRLSSAVHLQLSPGGVGWVQN
ncbi:penicillin-binding protein 1C [Anopheles sinensis]|uniref:Penicillin-binding protein 1C n=1 Tax=Anopheles sinensis TaxID=74873 RepID=A0A084WCW5_ANOSI|nr:penicillin-binding protein 1C [Anopheles sinensis]